MIEKTNKRDKRGQRLFYIEKGAVPWSSSTKIGFTLIEIILVLLLLAIVSGLTVPNFSKTYQRLELKKAANDIAYLMRYAQSRAIAKGHQIRFEFAEDFTGYELKEQSSDKKQADEEFKNISGRLGNHFQVPQILHVSSEDTVINFFPDGTIDKQRISVCSVKEEKCFTISTQEQRGRVLVFHEKLE